MSTILAIAQDVADDIGLQRPASLFAAYDEGDTTDRRMLRGLRKLHRFLRDYWDWPDLRAERTFTSVSGATQTGAWPSPNDVRRIIKGTVYDRSNHAHIDGPLTATEWQRREASVVAVDKPRFTLRGGLFLLKTEYAAGATIAYEYIRDRIGRTSSADSTLIADFTADTNISVWDDELVTLGLTWVMLHRDGQTNNVDYAAFEMALRERTTAEGAGDVLLMSSYVDEDTLVNVPDSFAGLT